MSDAARAATTDCTTAADGTPCTGCVVGFCQRGVCEGIRQPDGLPCASGDRCTQGDSCSGGVCTSGPAIMCTPIDACHTASCNPEIGCQQTSVCDISTGVDGGRPNPDGGAGDGAPPLGDGGTAPPDGSSPNLGRVRGNNLAGGCSVDGRAAAVEWTGLGLAVLLLAPRLVVSGRARRRRT